MTQPRPARFVDIDVEPGPASADGITLRYKLAHGVVRTVNAVDWASDDGVSGTWSVVALDEGDVEVPARAAYVEDSSDGEVLLVLGGRQGLRLVHPSGVEAREPYLLLARSTRIA